MIDVTGHLAIGRTAKTAWLGGDSGTLLARLSPLGNQEKLVRQLSR